MRLTAPYLQPDAGDAGHCDTGAGLDRLAGLQLRRPFLAVDENPARAVLERGDDPALVADQPGDIVVDVLPLDGRSAREIAAGGERRDDRQGGEDQYGLGEPQVEEAVDHRDHAGGGPRATAASRTPPAPRPPAAPRRRRPRSRPSGRDRDRRTTASR